MDGVRRYQGGLCYAVSGGIMAELKWGLIGMG